MSELALQPVADDAAWDALVRQSPQGTLFAGSAFLQAVGCPHQRWAVVQGQAVKAALLLPVSADGRAVVADDLVIHAGPMFTLDPQRQAVKRRHDAFEISSFVAAELARRFDRVELPMAPQVDDLRPFLWHAYHGETGLQYRLDLRYTSYVDVSSLAGVPADQSEQTACFQAMETVRRYSVREARRKGGSVQLATDPAALLSGYRALMETQGADAPPGRLTAMQRVMERLIADGCGALFHVHDGDGTLLYAVFYAWDHHRAYYLYGAGHPGRSTPWQGTLAHWHAFGHLARAHGITEVDLEGVNSPQRGWFKLGFGGSLQTYHTLHWSRPQ
jgi:hypothetical protein